MDLEQLFNVFHRTAASDEGWALVSVNQQEDEDLPPVYRPQVMSTRQRGLDDYDAMRLVMQGTGAHHAAARKCLRNLHREEYEMMRDYYAAGAPEGAP